MVARTIRLCPKHRDLPIVVGKTVLPECADCGTVRTSDPTDGLAEVLKLARAGYDRGERRPLSDRYEQLEEHQAAAVRAWLRERLKGNRRGPMVNIAWVEEALGLTLPLDDPESKTEAEK